MDAVVAFVVASDFERRIVEKSISVRPRHALHGKFAVAQCGVGFCDSSPLEKLPSITRIVSTGFAGGLESGLISGAILVPEIVIGTDRNKRHIDGACRDQLADMLVNSHHISTGPLLETGEILATPAAKASAADEFAASGVDMESARIADYCSQHNQEFVVIRTVLDPVEMSMPRAIIDTTTNGEVPGALTLASRLLTTPADWPNFARLLLNVWIARRALHSALANSLPLLVDASPGREGIVTDSA